MSFTSTALPIAFAVLIACALTSLASAIVLFVFRLRRTNQLLRHPYLDHQSFERFPFPVRLAILLDYFFRLVLPNSQFWLVGNANRLLKHVRPKEVPTAIKWPLIGMWGGCFAGIAVMLLVWALTFLRLQNIA